MHRAKLFLLTSATIISVLACGGSATNGPYSIRDSKGYAASLFRQNCAICHGPEAEGQTLPNGTQIPNLRAKPHKYNTDNEIYRHITDGGNGMVPFRGQLSEREINMMVDFVRKDLRGER
jgi:mono/diheme cytochrome c family protein